jgi:predicted aconitase with swiveling domain
VIRIAGVAWVTGEARGPALRLERPLSFWGGVDPATATVSDPRHPQHGASLENRVVLLSATVGSSSSSAILLELIRNGRAPAGIVLARPDAILALGSLVARELGYRPVPIYLAPEPTWTDIQTDDLVELAPAPATTL